MSSANDKQIGGGHYKGTGYEWWDFVAKAGLGYHDGNAGKYVVRWEKKGGLLDLQKADHYLEKCIELDVRPKYSGVTTEREVDSFVQVNNLGVEESECLRHICRGNHREARVVLARLSARASEA